MRRIARECRGTADVAAVGGGVRTRVMAMPVAAAAGASSEDVTAKRIRIVGYGELRRRAGTEVNSSNSIESCVDEERNCSSEVSERAASCCSSNAASIESVDPVKNESGAENEKSSTDSISTNRQRVETTPSREFLSESSDERMEDSTATSNSRDRTRVPKMMPSDSSEIEEFFAGAEKDLQKRFIDKYNFDIVKDVPLEGRYQWVPVKP